jgi:hypothetical protein
VPPEYLLAIAHDKLGAEQYLIVRRGRSYDLTNPTQREIACEVILSLLRYLSDAYIRFFLAVAVGNIPRGISL